MAKERCVVSGNRDEEWCIKTMIKLIKSGRQKKTTTMSLMRLRMIQIKSSRFAYQAHDDLFLSTSMNIDHF